ncbi:MAG: ketopantoate reductase C-terminal domain-containing protein [Vulcanimicrobiota bacterium]
MTALVFGAGAIGQWLGALLHSSGSDVLLHVRPGVKQAIDELGGVVLNNAPPVAVPMSSSLDELRGKEFKTVICTVKTYAVASALKELKEAEIQFEELVSFQNGWGTDPQYVEAFPTTNFWTLTTTRAVGVDRPGFLSPAQKGGLAVAPWSSGVRGIPQCLRRVTIPLVVLERSLDLKWSKLLLNLIGNATGAITGLPPNQLAGHSRLMKAELLLAREAIAVANALGVRRSDLPGFPIKLLSTALEKMPLRLVAPVISAKMRQARGDKLPSLFFDLEEPGRPTEIDSLNGAVVQEGLATGVPTPKQDALVKLFHRCREDQELWTLLQAEPVRLLEYV